MDGWYCQSITNKKIFLNIYEQRLIDCFQQECDALLFLHHPQNGLNSAISQKSIIHNHTLLKQYQPNRSSYLQNID